MFAQVLWFSTVILGINVGWQPLPEGGMEYIIQLDSATLESLKAGQPIQSDIRPEIGDIRSYRIILGTDQLPRINPPAPSENNSQNAITPSSPPSENSSPAQKEPSPRKLSPEPSVKPLTAQSAAFVESTEKASKAINDEPAKPWMPLILVSLCLFASLGGNLFLVWIFADLRRRFQASLSK
jgi:hypothetical protein